MKFMENFIKLMLAFGIGLLLVLLAMPKVIPFLHKMKFGQVEREEGLESHKKKGGTPTMGGVVFVLAAVIAAFVVNYKNITNPNLILITIVLVGYSLIGFIDDALIILKHQNEGLKAWQKFLMQAILAVGCYLYLENFVPGFTTEVTIPIVKVNIDFGWFYAVLVFIMFTGESNGVNLSDGLDGLATGLSMVAIAPFIIYAIMIKDYVVASYGAAMIGALLGFMFFNYHPARIFMGDVGSLGLGGFLAILAILTKQELLLIVVGGVFLMETLSVIIQVVSFKTRGKRVFKMAPIHHHFEMLGWSEQQVTISFWFIGFICGIICQDHDLEQMYLDSFLKLACLEGADIEETYKTLETISEKYHVKFVLSISMNAADLPECAKESVVVSL